MRGGGQAAMTLVPRAESLLLTSAERHPSRSALRDDTCDVSYEELQRRVERLASVLTSLAGESGSGPPLASRLVALVCANVPAFVVGLFATWRSGGTVVPVDARLRAHDLSAVLSDAAPTVILSTAEPQSALGKGLTKVIPQLPS